MYNNGLIIEKKITCSIKECSEEIISKKQKNFDGNKIGYNCIPYIQDSKNIKITNSFELGVTEKDNRNCLVSSTEIKLINSEFTIDKNLIHYEDNIIFKNCFA